MLSENTIFYALKNKKNRKQLLVVKCIFCIFCFREQKTVQFPNNNRSATNFRKSLNL